MNDRYCLSCGGVPPALKPKTQTGEKVCRCGAFCPHENVARVSAKCSDLCWVKYPNGRETDGYVPDDLGIGGGDYIEFRWCQDCMTILKDAPR